MIVNLIIHGVDQFLHAVVVSSVVAELCYVYFIGIYREVIDLDFLVGISGRICSVLLVRPILHFTALWFYIHHWRSTS